MTRDEILSMEAGRELDALIHKSLFPDSMQPSDVQSPSWQDAYGYEETNYSTDIAAAFRAAEKVELFNFFYLTKDIKWQIGNHGEYGFDEFRVIVEADTAQLVICLAILLYAMETGER